MKRFMLLFVTICLCFVLSITAFASDEQPSGSSYEYKNSTGTSYYSTYWTAVTKSLVALVTIGRSIDTNTSNASSYLNTIKSDVASIKSSISSGSGSSGTNTNPSGSNYNYYSGSLTTMYSNYWSATSYSLSYIGKDTYNIKSLLNDIENEVDGLEGYLDGVEGSLTNIYHSVDGIEGYIDGVENSLSSISTNTSNTVTKLESSNTLLTSIKGFVQDIHDVIANATDKNLRNNQEANIVQASSDFFSGTSSATSVGVGNISSVKSTFGSAQSFFGMGEGIDVFGSLNDQSSSGPWVWFSQDVADDMDSVQTRRDEVYIDFLSEKYNDLNSRLGGDEGDNR